MKTSQILGFWHAKRHCSDVACVHAIWFTVCVGRKDHTSGCYNRVNICMFRERFHAFFLGHVKYQTLLDQMLHLYVICTKLVINPMNSTLIMTRKKTIYTHVYQMNVGSRRRRR